MKLTRTTRNVGWLVVAGLLGAALIAPATALADGSNPTSDDECGSTYAYYFKIQAPENGSYESGDAGVETNWPGQALTISNATNANQSFDWASTQVVLKVAVKYGNFYFWPTIAPNGLSGSVVNANQNAISHVTWCGNPVTTSSSSSSSSTSSSTTSSTSTIDTVTTTSQTTQTTETSITGTVSGETGDPTPPSTDTVAFSSTSSTTGGGWSLLLIAMAGLLAAALLLTPAAATRKR